VGSRDNLQSMGNKIPLSLLGINPQFRQLIARFSPRRPWFEPRSGHVGFAVNKVALGQVFSEQFSFPYQFSFRRMFHTHLSYEAGTIGQIEAPHPEKL
jgi:hypothetical protein